MPQLWLMTMRCPRSRFLVLLPLALPLLAWQWNDVRSTAPGLLAVELRAAPAAVARERKPLSEDRADVIVYGGTPAGIAAAAAVAREGRTVILIEPSKHVDGIVAGGLGATDKGIAQTVGGFSRRYFEMVGEHYGKRIAWAFEPHVAEDTFEKWLTETDGQLLTVVREERLDLSSGVEMDDLRIVAIQMESGRRYSGRVFVDASYEGDLLAGAGVSYHVGRESREHYGEPLAGVFQPGKGLLWFLASDPRVPANVRKEMQRYGYPRDEYPDNDHWSYQLYVRETRRMVGAQVLTEQDCLRTDSQTDSVGMGSYAPDSHHVQRVVLDGRVVNEGNFYLHHHAYEIPYGA